MIKRGFAVRVVAPEQTRELEQLGVDLCGPRHVLVRDGSGWEDAEEFVREVERE